MWYIHKNKTLLHNKKEYTVVHATWCISKALYQLREARHRRVHTMWFHLYEILKTKLEWQKTYQWLPGAWNKGRGFIAKGHEKTFCGDGNVWWNIWKNIEKISSQIVW